MKKRSLTYEQLPLIDLIYRHWKKFLACGAAGTVLAIAISMLIPKEYEYGGSFIIAHVANGATPAPIADPLEVRSRMEELAVKAGIRGFHMFRISELLFTVKVRDRSPEHAKIELNRILESAYSLYRPSYDALFSAQQKSYRDASREVQLLESLTSVTPRLSGSGSSLSKDELARHYYLHQMRQNLITLRVQLAHLERALTPDLSNFFEFREVAGYQKPVYPKHLAFALYGILIGLLAGLVWAYASEQKASKA